MEKIEKYLGMISLVLFIMCWEIIHDFEYFRSQYLPPPSIVLSRLLFQLGSEGDLGIQILYSFKRLLIGSMLAIPLALLIALMSFVHRWFKKVITPFIALIYPLPKIAIYPVFLLFWGLGDFPKILIIFLGVFFLVYLHTLHGFERLNNQGLFQVVKVYHLGAMDQFVRILLLGALPEILEGIKLGLGYGLVMIVASEYTVAQNGIGFFMWNAWDQFRPVDVFCGLYVLSFWGMIIFSTIDAIKRKLSNRYFRDEYYYSGSMPK